MGLNPKGSLKQGIKGTASDTSYIAIAGLFDFSNYQNLRFRAHS